VALLVLLEKWFEMSVTCVRWHGHDSEFLRLIAGVRQNGVLSPFLFTIFVDDIGKKFSLSVVVAMCPTYVLVFSCTPTISCYYLPLSVAYRNCCLLVKRNCIFWTYVSVIKSRFVYVSVTGMMYVVHL